MRHTFHRSIYRLGLITTVVIGSAVGVFAITGNVPSALSRAFEFPVSLGSAVTGDLIRPIGALPSLTFDHGVIAVGVLPVPLPQPLARLRQLRNQQPFFLPAPDDTPHARLLLSGVVDATGAPVSNTGNQLLIDAAVSPDDAATTMPPFVIPFDITGGMAYVDAALPIQTQSDAPVAVQVNGISVTDPNGQLFGVLGFQLAPRAATPTPVMTSTPGGTPSPQPGQCFVGPDCMGPWFPAPQNLCCHYTRPGTAVGLATSWCPPDQFDPQTGHCASNACVACGTQAPTPTPGANACGSGSACRGSCTGICRDGSVAPGKCQPAIFNGPITFPGSTLGPPGGLCRCVPDCPGPPTPTPGPCGDLAQCGGTCPFTCPDGSAAVGRCQLLGIDPSAKPGQPFGSTCTCLADCPPPPSPTPGVCGANGMCQGTCTATCLDGTTETGKCVGVSPMSPLGTVACTCVVSCNQLPTPTPTPQCTSLPCGGQCTISPCPPGALCPIRLGQCTSDAAGECQCIPISPPTQPPLPTPTPQCASAPCEGQCVIVPPCPPGEACPNFVLQGECRDDASGTCQCMPSSAPTQTPAPTCAADADCNDNDACTIDHCVSGKCEHACICLTAAGAPACCPGPAALCDRPCGAEASGVCGGTCPSGATCESLPTAQAPCGCVSDVGGPCGGNILAPPPVCAPGLVCQQSLPDITGVCVKPTCIPFFTAGCSQTSDCCQPCSSGTRAPCAICNQGTCVGTP